MFVNGHDVSGLRPLHDSFDGPLLTEDLDRDSPLIWHIFERSKSAVDNENILARAVGPFCVLDAASRNNRYYSSELWERAFHNTKQMCSEGLMIGTVGHDGKIDDQALREGLVSHRVTKLWTDHGNKVGMGELLVFNTLAGKNLNAYLRGGVSLRVSSRAYGDYDGKEGKADRVKADTFVLETFDFVKNAGIDHAIPRVVEDDDPGRIHPYTVRTESDDDERDRDRDPARSVHEERKPRMSTNIDEATKGMLEDWRTEKSNLVSQVEAATSKNATLSAQLDLKEQASARLDDDLKTERTSHAESNDKLEAAELELVAFREMGDPPTIARALEAAKSLGLRHREAGKDAGLDVRISKLEQYEEMGEPEEIQEVFASTKEYINLGTPQDIQEVCTIASRYAALGTPDQITQVCEYMTKYLELGTVDSIEEALEKALEMTNEHRETLIDRMAENVATEHNVETTVARELLSRVGGDEEAAGKIIEGVRDSSASFTERYRKNPKRERSADTKTGSIKRMISEAQAASREADDKTHREDKRARMTEDDESTRRSDERKRTNQSRGGSGIFEESSTARLLKRTAM